MARETEELAETAQVNLKRTIAKVELSTFAVACRHQQETSEKLYFRGFSGELNTVFRKTSVGL
jgi:hypothetical protein